MSAIVVIPAALVVAVGGYRWYAGFVDRKVIESDPNRVTPAKMYMDGVDFMPTPKNVLFGYQFKSIAGSGPVVGAIIALQWGWLPALLWLFLGVLFIGWVHDYVSGMVSMRCDGLSLGGLSYKLISPRVALVSRFVWMDYIFGALLIFTAIKMILSQDQNLEPDKNPLVKLARRFYPVSNSFKGHHFFTRTEDGKRAITPLFVTLIVIESTDVLFAFDSIPAIFAITRDPFLIFTSNIFAILGLRSMYFFLAAMMEKFRYIKFSLVFVLVYVGIKMLLSHHYTIPMGVTLGVIGIFLLSGILGSIYSNHRRSIKQVIESGEETNGVPKNTLKKKQLDAPPEQRSCPVPMLRNFATRSRQNKCRCR